MVEVIYSENKEIASNPLTIRYGTKPVPTGWAFKDVKHPHNLMDKGDWGRYSKALSGKRWSVVALPIRQIYATQKQVNSDFKTYTASHKELPVVLRKNRMLFAMDGHHRIMKAAANGKQTVRVRLVDLDAREKKHPDLFDRKRE